MTAASEGKYIFQYAQSNTGYHCTDRICIPNFNKILDNLANWGVGSGEWDMGHGALGNSMQGFWIDDSATESESAYSCGGQATRSVS
ncbi:MAG: hypothetical protein V7L00_24175 [Nostoc sp.]|uniref:hypothetical protein n=1 Tax=Nostoc sp. TaxID=1180 RepID=UPI002FFC6DA5